MSVMTTPLSIGALIDFNEWGFHILKADIDVPDDPCDGMWDGLLENEAVIDMMWKNYTSDETTAVEMNWDDNRTNRYPAIPHGVIGCQCSSASMSVARVSELEHVPVVSMSSTSYQPKGGDDDDLKTFFHTVAPPDDVRGQVGAFVALFRTFGWDRVGTQFSRGATTKFGGAWVEHSATVEEGGNAYQAILEIFNSYQASLGNSSVLDLPTYAAETVDAIPTLGRAVVLLSAGGRDNRTAVINDLYYTNFTRLSGRVAFDRGGRFRKNPHYTLLNLQEDGFISIPGNLTYYGGVGVPMANISALFGRNLCYVHMDMYHVPGVPPPTWMYSLFPIIALLITVLLITYLLVRRNLHEMLANINAQVEDARREELLETPDTWSASTDNLVEVFPEDEQYWSVTRELRKSMDDAWISKLWRVQNKPLWTYYSFHKKRFAMNRIDDTELDVWHGTSSVEPTRIYSCTQDGFMTQFCREGLWGRGLYFATKSSYSHRYSYKPDENLTPHSDEREMFLVKFLVGNAVQMNRDESPTKAAECSALTVPPINPRTGKKYNTVTGWTDGSHIWVVYENGRAYPNYLVRYYKGERDPTRTPYKCKEDMARRVTPPLRQPPLAKTFVWEFEDDGWHPIASQSQAIVESAYLAYSNGVSPLSTKMFQGNMWTYEVDFDTMSQINTTHFRHTQRTVRRREVDVDVQLP